MTNLTAVCRCTNSQTGCDRLVGDSPLSGGNCNRVSEPKARACRRAEAQEARNQPAGGLSA